MDWRKQDELQCGVCFELFDEALKCPRVLECGHSFCHGCLDNLLTFSPACPNCKERIRYAKANLVPVNYVVKSLVLQLNGKSSNVQSIPGLISNSKEGDESQESLLFKNEKSFKGLASEGFCEEHDSYKHFRCMDCEKWICGVCAVVSHKPCQTLLVVEALKELKQTVFQKVENLTENETYQNTHVDTLLKGLEMKRISLKKEIKNLQMDLKSKVEKMKSFGKCIEELQSLKRDRKKFCEKLKCMKTKIEETANNEQFLKTTDKLEDFLTQSRSWIEELTIPKQCHNHLSQEALKEWCQHGSVYAVRSHNGMSQYGKVIVKGGTVWLHSLKRQRPEGKNLTISFKKLLTNFGGSVGLPKRAFLQFGNESEVLDEVIITIDADTSWALGFLLLFLGVKDDDYIGLPVEDVTTSISLRRKIGIGIFREPIVKRKTTAVAGCYPKGSITIVISDDRRMSHFTIHMEETPTRFKNVRQFGSVVEGIGSCEKVFKSPTNSFSIMNCGLVF